MPIASSTIAQAGMLFENGMGNGNINPRPAIDTGAQSSHRARRVRLALKAKQIDGQHAEHAGVKGDPEPEIRLHKNSD